MFIPSPQVGKDTLISPEQVQLRVQKGNVYIAKSIAENFALKNFKDVKIKQVCVMHTTNQTLFSKSRF